LNESRAPRVRRPELSAQSISLCLILVSRSDNRFYLHTASGGSRLCPRLEVPLPQARNERTRLQGLVSSAARKKFGFEVSYLGLLASIESAKGHELLAVATVDMDLAAAGRAALSPVALSETREATGAVEYGGYFDSALQWMAADVAASTLGESMRLSVDSSLDYLEKHICEEKGLRGWNQYQDGSPLGLISTAQGLLCHTHVGSHAEIVESAARTIEAMQNPDGGWQVRRALVGGPSQRSITESTSFCVWALQETGRSTENDAVHKGVAWLTGMQNPDGGWHSSLVGNESYVVATSLAVKVLASSRQAEPVARAVRWLKGVQNADGGWGPTAAPKDSAASNSSPAYAAHALVALLDGGVPASDRAVEQGCAYLRNSFESTHEEPWSSTSSNALIDPETYARMDFRHFATPWALAALSRAGYGLNNHHVLLGVRRLLQLQQPSGAWRCGLTAPQAFPIWAAHDALLALKYVGLATSQSISPVVLEHYKEQECRALEDAVVRISQYSSTASEKKTRKQYFSTAWMSTLTLLIAVLALNATGVLKTLGEDSGVHRAAAGALTVVVALVSALAPHIVAEEYKMWRERRAHHRYLTHEESPS
jgi:hypothetical protein